MLDIHIFNMSIGQYDPFICKQQQKSPQQSEVETLCPLALLWIASHRGSNYGSLSQLCVWPCDGQLLLPTKELLQFYSYCLFNIYSSFIRFTAYILYYGILKISVYSSNKFIHAYNEPLLKHVSKTMFI